MAKNNLEEELIQKISPTKIATYLIYKGWKKEKEVEGVLSLWSFKKQDSNKVTLLLPLDNEFADFEIKIEELLSVLARFEARNETEVLKTLANISVIAQRDYREIVDIKIESVLDEENSLYEVPAKETGSLLRSLSSLFESMGDSIKKKTRKIKPKAIIESELKLSLLDTFQGSFGIRTGLGVYEEARQTNLLESPAAEQAAENLINLILAGSSDNPELLREEIEKLEKDSLIKFKNFIRSLASLNSNLVLEWGSVNPNKGAVVSFPYYKIIQALEIITKIELENPYQYHVIGKLIVAGVGKGKEKRAFILVDEINKKEYKGHISLELINNFNNYIELDKFYMATIEETPGLNEITGEEIRLYTLIDLEEITGED